jgi:hypothetical protein
LWSFAVRDGTSLQMTFDGLLLERGVPGQRRTRTWCGDQSVNGVKDAEESLNKKGEEEGIPGEPRGEKGLDTKQLQLE